MRGWVRLVRRRVTHGLALDLGCGGAELGPLLGSSFATIGVDLQPRPQSWPTSLESSEDLLRGDATALPLRSDWFDLVIALDVFEHVTDSASLTHEIARVLKPGGWLFISTPNPGSWGHRLKGPQWFGFRDPAHVNVRPLAFWKERLSEAGIGVVTAGTDRLWDPPYLRGVPSALQRLGFGAASRLMLFPSISHRWSGGENTLLVCQKGVQRGDRP